MVCAFFPILVNAADQASQLFENNKAKVYQIKVIDIASGNKSSIGSGFQVGQEGIVATNYHVVSSYILEPEKFRIELVDHQDNIHNLSLLSFDIVHDIALVQTESLLDEVFVLQQSPLSQGSRIYSMGNPHDLGMTIIEGTYNGLVEGSRYKKYLFSGSLNAGMSGGPTLNEKGEVIGLNVSKGGEQLSFLVPIKHLVSLMSNHVVQPKPALKEYKEHIFDALYADQDSYYPMLFDKAWSTKTFMSYELPDKIDVSLKCWGHTKSKKEHLYKNVHRHCRTEDRIYIDSNFYTGGFSYDYKHISTDKLNVFRFYELLEGNYTISGFYNGNKSHVTNFICETNFITLDGAKWKATSCVREYLDYRGLYDATLFAMRIDKPDETLAINIRSTGISQRNILNLHAKFMELVSWNQ